jgi:hypothetical protein
MYSKTLSQIFFIVLDIKDITLHFKQNHYSSDMRTPQPKLVLATVSRGVQIRSDRIRSDFGTKIHFGLDRIDKVVS